jgi:hypothetical protein
MKPGWLSSETHLATIAIGALAHALGQPHWPSVHVAAALGIALVAHSHIKNRTLLKRGDPDSPGFLSVVFNWWRNRAAAKPKGP